MAQGIIHPGEPGYGPPPGPSFEYKPPVGGFGFPAPAIRSAYDGSLVPGFGGTPVGPGHPGFQGQAPPPQRRDTGIMPLPQRGGLAGKIAEALARARSLRSGPIQNWRQAEMAAPAPAAPTFWNNALFNDQAGTSMARPTRFGFQG